MRFNERHFWLACLYVAGYINAIHFQRDETLGISTRFDPQRKWFDPVSRAGDAKSAFTGARITVSEKDHSCH